MVTVEEIRVVETQDAGMGRQDVLENVLFDRDTRAVHVEFLLLLADEDLLVAHALDDPDLALAAFADLGELIVLVLDFIGIVAFVADDCSFVEDFPGRFGWFRFFFKEGHCCRFPRDTR